MITIIGLGPGDAESVPAAALQALAIGGPILAPALDADLARLLPVPPAPLPEDLAALSADTWIAAPDAEAHRLARRLPAAATVPARDVLRRRAIGAEVAALAAVGARLRRECPWDRDQTTETIVPHTVEEAFEVVEAVADGRLDRIADELGDLLFQAVFLAQLIEEEGGEHDLAQVARGQTAKLIHRHPHVYGERPAADAGTVVDIWDERKRAERADQGIFHELPAGLPGLAFAAKTHRRAEAAGVRLGSLDHALAKLSEEVGELAADPGGSELGDVLLAAVAVARRLTVDPEIAVRAAAGRFRARIERAIELAEASGRRYGDLDRDAQIEWYGRAKEQIEAAGDGVGV